MGEHFFAPGFYRFRHTIVFTNRISQGQLEQIGDRHPHLIFPVFFKHETGRILAIFRCGNGFICLKILVKHSIGKPVEHPAGKPYP